MILRYDDDTDDATMVSDGEVVEPVTATHEKGRPA